MSDFKIKSASNKVVHSFTSVAFIVSFSDFVNDEFTVRYTLIEDNTQICYLDFVVNTLKTQGLFSYNVLVDVDVPKTRDDLVYPDKSNHFKESWNEKLKAVLNRSSFDSIIKIFKLNTSNRITFAVQRTNDKFLK